MTAGSWGLVDPTSYNNSETTTTALTTAYQASSGATTGVITVDGVALKLSVRTGITGTLSVHLAIAGVEVPGTLVTINTADLPVSATADLNGGWIFFKFASPVTLAGATSYTVEAKTSSSAQVSLFSTSGSNWSRALVTTTTGAPVAGDDVIIGGEYTGAGTSNSFTITMDETGSTDYGANSTSLVTPAIAICAKSTLAFGSTASTNYNLKISGHLIIYSGGTFNMGTIATPIPRTGSAVVQFDCGANVDFGLTPRNLSTWNSQGLSRTSGKTIYSAKLNADAAANATTLNIDTDTGWLSGDSIAVATTTRTASQCESGTLNGNAGASSLTVNGFAGTGGGVANAHSGTSPTQAEVILLTRNVRVIGASISLQAFIDIKATANVDCDWTEFKWLGSATANKRGIDSANTTGSVSFQYCSIRDFGVASSVGFNATGTTGGFTFSNNTMFSVKGNAFMVAGTSAAWTADSNFFIYDNAGGLSGINLSDLGGTFTNNTIVGWTTGMVMNESAVIAGTFSNLTIHGCSGLGLQILAGMITITTLALWRCNSSGFQASSAGEIIIDGSNFFGNLNNNIFISGTAKLVFLNINSNGDSAFATTNGINIQPGTAAEVICQSGNFSTASGIKTAHTNDLNMSAGFLRMFLNNTILAASTELTGQTTLSPSSFISSQKHDQTAGSHKTWKRYGTLIIETTTVHTGSQSLKMTPNNASYKLESGSFLIPVASGQTLTPTVFVYEDGSYNGNRCRLILKRNDSIGITADTVIATHVGVHDAAWEALSGTTASASADGVMEFIIDCDGTAGNAFIDSFRVA